MPQDVGGIKNLKIRFEDTYSKSREGSNQNEILDKTLSHSMFRIQYVGMQYAYVGTKVINQADHF